MHRNLVSHEGICWGMGQILNMGLSCWKLGTIANPIVISRFTIHTWQISTLLHDCLIAEAINMRTFPMGKRQWQQKGVKTAQ